MKFIPLSFTIAIILLQQPLKAGESDTLTVNEYLGLFKQKFEFSYDFRGMGGFDTVSIKKHNAFGALVPTLTKLQGKKIKLDNGTIIEPEIYGQAYSYRKINDYIYWLATYQGGGENGSSFALSVLDTKSGETSSRLYVLAQGGGDEGYWWSRYGEFINDSVYQYTYYGYFGDNDIDSIIGKDKISTSGKIVELEKISLK